MQLDFENGKLTAYGFTIKAFRDSNPKHYILIDSSGETETIDNASVKVPLKVHGTEDFKVTWDGKVYASYIEATKGGKIGPFYFDNDAFWTGEKNIGGSGIYIHKTAGFGVSSGKFTVDGSGNLSVNNGQFYVANTGETTITASAHIDGDLYISGKIIGNNWQVDGTSAGGAGGFKGGNTSGGCAGFGNINAAGGKIGNWIIGTKTGTLEDSTGSVILDPTGKIKLGNTFIADSTAGSTTLVLGKGSIMASEGNENKIVVYESLIGIYSDPLYVIGSISCGGGEGKESSFNNGLKIRNGKSLTLEGAGGQINAESAIVTGKELHAKNGRTNKYTVKIGLTKSIDLKFTDGILVGAFNSDGSSIPDSDTDSNLTTEEAKHIVSSLYSLKSGNIGSDRLGKLAWKDDVEISSASFNLGGSALSVGRPTISGDTATYQVTIPGQRYSMSGGSVSYSGTEYRYVITDSDGKYVGFQSSSDVQTGQTAHRVAISYSGTKSYNGSSGTTASRTLTAKITVKAT